MLCVVDAKYLHVANLLVSSGAIHQDPHSYAEISALKTCLKQHVQRTLLCLGSALGWGGTSF